jgi:hypothetical protein
VTIYEHVTSFAGLPVVEFDPQVPPPGDPGGVAWRVSTDYDGGKDLFEQRLDALVDAPWAGEVGALVVGEWGESYDSVVPLDRLVAAAARLTSLSAVFLGEMTSEENEISWIKQTDVTPLLQAYPAMEVLRVRGGDGLALQPGRYPVLRELAFEAGGLSAGVVRAVGDCDLGDLRHLELWLGTDNYGGDATVEDLATILSGARLPALTYLGLRDAEIADQVAAALAGAPVVGRVRTLDLSLGMLSDVGAAALLSGQPLTHLDRLDLHHHFLSEEMMARLRAELEPTGVELDLSDAEGADTEAAERYIAVAE